MNNRNLLKRALRFLDRFTLVTMNSQGSYDSPHTGQNGRMMSGPRLF